MSRKYKGTLRSVGVLSFCRLRDGLLVVEIKDVNRKATICEIRMTADDLIHVLAGWGDRPGELYVNMDYDPEEQPINE